MPRPATVAELCKLVAGDLRGGSPDAVMVGVSTLLDAGPEHISWVSEARYARDLARSRAGAVIVPPAVQHTPMPAIVTSDPERAIAQVLGRFRDPIERPLPSVHPTAMVAANARLAAGACIGAHAWVGDGAEIGPDCVLHPGAHVASRCRLGRACELFPHAYVGDRCILGDRVVLKPCAVVGADGFGFIFRNGAHQRIPHTGIVVLEDDVEVGANSCVDRAKVGATVVGRGTKIDNQVQVGHNCQIGPLCILVAQVGLSGSVHLGTGVQFGGRSGAIPGVHICDGARVGGAAVVARDITATGDYAGAPARPHIEHNRALAATRRVPELLAEIRQLRQELAALRIAPK